MTISTTESKVVYVGNGTTGPFSFSFKIFDSTDLIVKKYTIADGTTTTMVVTTDYTISGTFPGTGSITLTSSLSSSYKLILQRAVPYTQTTDLQENDDLPADTIETMNDRNVAQVQQVKEIADRALVLDTSNTSGITLSTFVGQALKYLRINSGETGIEYGNPSSTSTDYPGTISYGADASKSASPSTGDVYFATNTSKIYVCWSAGSWTYYAPIVDASVTTSKLDSSVASGLTTVTGVSGDYAVISDTSDSGNVKKALMSDFVSGLSAYTDTRFKISNFTRDLTTASGTQAVTGVGFSPKAIIFLSVLDGLAASWGFSNVTGDRGLLFRGAGGPIYGTGCIQLQLNTTPDQQYANVQSLDADGFTLNWTKQNSPTGTASIFYMAFR